MLFVCLSHCPRTRLWGEDSLVAISLQLGQKETVKLFRFYFLCTHRKQFSNNFLHQYDSRKHNNILA